VRAVRESGPWLVCEDDGGSGGVGQVVGYAYAARHRERAAYRFSVDATVYLDARHHRRGLGSALYRALFGILRTQGYKAVHAGITLPNPASVGLHESLGFRQCALFPKVGWKLGRWHDVGWWQLELAARDAQPAELISVDEALRASSPPLATAARSDDGG